MAERVNHNNAGLGMRFPRSVLNQLRDLKLIVKTSVSIVFQQRAKRWLLAGDEGGGSLKNLAHYVGYVAVSNNDLKFSLPIQTLIPNATHRRVAGTSLVRFEILRYDQSCDLSVTHLFLNSEDENRRPTVRRDTLFQGRSGVLTADAELPIFFDRTGEQVELPAPLIDGIQTLSKASFCMHCHHAHFISVKPIDVQGVLTSIRGNHELNPSTEDEVAKPIMTLTAGTPVSKRPESRVTVINLQDVKGA